MTSSGDLAAALEVSLKKEVVKAGFVVQRWSDSPLPLRPTVTSQLATDDSEAGSYLVSPLISQALTVSADNLAFLDEQFRGTTLRPFALYPNVRASLEAACIALWVMTGPSRRDRVARSFELSMQDLRDSANAREAIGQDGRRERIDRLKAETWSRSIPPRKGRLTSMVYVRQASDWMTSHSDIDAGDLSVKAVWMATSGIAHARPWAMLSLSKRETVPSDDALVSNVSLTADIRSLAVSFLYAVMTHDAARRLFVEQCRSTLWHPGRA